jgi:SAM-dependent methyltransferase
MSETKQPNAAYFNVRFRDYEWALHNIKTLGYELGRIRAAEVLHAPPVGPERAALTSRVCLQSDMEAPWTTFWSSEMCTGVFYHRKVWELCYISQALFNEGMLRPGTKGLGFGCGEEPLPSLFAKYGAGIIVTDQEPDEAARQGWAATGQHAATLDRVRLPHVCPDLEKLATIDLRYVDMNRIPDDLTGQFDFCWSACALEHLGSIANGLAFIENSIKTLKPGGVAVHTLEFNLSEGPETIDNWPTVLFQKKHMQDIEQRLAAQGHHVVALEFDVGDGLLDRFIDLPPWHTDVVRLATPFAHLRLSVDGFACTSFGIIVKAAG